MLGLAMRAERGRAITSRYGQRHPVYCVERVALVRQLRHALATFCLMPNFAMHSCGQVAQTLPASLTESELARSKPASEQSQP